MIRAYDRTNQTITLRDSELHSTICIIYDWRNIYRWTFDAPNVSTQGEGSFIEMNKVLALDLPDIKFISDMFTQVTQNTQTKETN